MWHVLALALGGRSVTEWQQTMPRPEFLWWVEFYKLYPFDDFHRYHRPAALASIAGATGDRVSETLQKRLDWLQPDPRNADLSDADMATLRAFGFTSKGT
jgi:hypothetical protein